MTLTVGSLFSGIGGLDLGLERAGMKVIWQSEIDPYCCKVLRKHWPEVPNHGNIKQIDWQTIQRPDVICGGYPCQPFSTAGKKQGENDPKHLWPQYFTAIRTLRPKFAIMENVANHLVRGFGTVLADLASIRYDAQWDCIPAAALGAPHLRDRVFIIALDANSNSQLRSPIHEAPQRSRWLPEPNVGRVAHGIPHRVDRLRGLGNAVVPQVAEYIGRLITQLN